MASLSSVAPCQHLTSVLATLRNPVANIPGRAVQMVVHASCKSVVGGWRWPSSIHGGGGRAVGNSGARAASSVTDNAAAGSGIGVAKFYTGKNILIICGTGFVAKVLMEKILRTNPDIGKIYVMVKAKDTQAALKRLQKEVPVDVVVNAMMAAMAKHGGGMAMVPGNCLYHLTSSTMKPMVAREMGRYMYQHFSQSPLIDKAGRPIIVQPPSAISNMEEFIRYVRSNVVLPEGNREDMSLPQQARSRLRAKAIAEQFIHISRIYEPYTFYGGRFDSANTEALFVEMSVQERAMFHFDMRSIYWMDYITNVHIPGLWKHVLKEEQHEVNPPVSDAASLL